MLFHYVNLRKISFLAKFRAHKTIIKKCLLVNMIRKNKGIEMLKIVSLRRNISSILTPCHTSPE